jgi:hypothetical protein
MRTTLALLLTTGYAAAAVITVSDPATTAIPDGHSSGVVRSVVVPPPSFGDVVLGAEVDVNLGAVQGEPAFLGDLYLYLSNGTHLSVLVNRPGRRTGAPAGYSDNQSMIVTFSTAGAADIHDYRVTAAGSHTNPLTGALTGIWQPDGRAVDPAVVLDTSPRTAGLGVFNGDTASGTWNLFAADLSTGALHQINGWTLRLTTPDIPEPGSTALLASALLLISRRRR